MKRQFILFSTLFFTILLLQARNFISGGINYEIKSTVSTFNVAVTSGIVYSGDIIIPETVRNNDTIFTVSSINVNAFNGNSGITSVSIPNTVSSIGVGAFYECIGISSINLDPGNMYFKYDNGILYNVNKSQLIYCQVNKTNKIDIPNTVISIETGAFYGCTGITYVTIPNSTTIVKSQAFYNCTGLTNVLIGDSTILGTKTSINIQSAAFEGCTNINSLSIYTPISSFSSPFQNLANLKTLAIGNSVTTINNSFFSSLTGLTKVILGQSEQTPVTISVSVGAFSNCENIETLILNSNLQLSSNNVSVSPFSKISNLIISDKLTTLGNYVFVGCKNLQKVNIPNGVTTIGISAFANCSNMTEITLGNSLMQLGSGVFMGCNALLNIYTSDANATYSSISGVLFNKNQQTLIQYPLGRIGAYEVPIQVNTIETNAFSSCGGLQAVLIPQSISLISASAFANCASLKTVGIGHADSISTATVNISSNAFNACLKLSKLNLNKSFTFTNGDNSPFKSLISIDSLLVGNGVTTIPEYTFSGCSGLKFVRMGLINGMNNNPITVSSSAFAACTNLANLELNRNINTTSAYTPFAALINLTVGNGVTFIGNNSFRECTNLISATLPSSLRKIGNGAFSNCNKLPSISLPEITELGPFAFYYCTALNAIILPNSLNIIQQSTFYNCTSLLSVDLGNSVTQIEDNAFTDCSKLISIDNPNSIKNIGTYAFKGCSSLLSINLGTFLEKIGTYTFSGCTSLQSILIPSTLQIIPEYVFENCSGLKELIIPNTVTSISSNAFYKCTGIATLQIGEYENSGSPLFCETAPFAGCSGIKTLILNKDILDDTNSSPFMSLLLLENVTISNHVSHINTFAFYGCTKITKLSIPNTVLSISDAAFQGCTMLSEINLPDFLSYIPNQLFYECTNLKSINIPSNVKSIGSYAFNKCSSLKAITIPHKVEIIGPLAFSNCTGLTEFTSSTTIPTPVGYNSFGSISLSTCNLYVPTGSKTNYQTAEQWKDFTNITEKEIINPTQPTDTITNVVKIVNISAGGLSAALTTSEIKSIIKLTVTGEMNSNDFTTIRGLTSLKFLDMSQAVVQSNTIPSSAFFGMYNLASVILPNSVTSIQTRAFESCNGLNKIKLPINLTSIESMTFARCSSLFTVEFPSTLTTIKSSAFYECGRLFLINSPSSLTTIEGNAFAKCAGLRSILLPTSITSLGEYAFAGCSSLQNITIPSSITSIERALFIDCISLQSVSLPSTLITLSSEVFVNCRRLKSIYSYATNPPTILYQMIFHNVNKNTCTLYVPKSSLNLYRQAEQWNEFLNIIEMANTDVRIQTVQPIILYPNPAIEGFNISGLTEPAILTLTSLKGDVVLRKQVIGNDYISISTFAEGVYIVKIANNNFSIEHKIVKI